MRHKHVQLLAAQPRAGAVLICVLACALIAMSLAASSIHLALQGARASKQNLRLRQTQWLLQAGVQRARQASQRQDYEGEQWIVPEEFLPESQGRIVIDVAASQADLGRVITVTAEYGAGGMPPIRRTQTFSVDDEPDN